MPFDPDKYLAEKSDSGEFNPDAYLASKQPSVSSNPDQNAPEGNLESLLRTGTGMFGATKHLASGLDAGADVATGKSPLEDLYNRYKAHLADRVATESQNAQNHPVAHYGGQILDALNPINPVIAGLKGVGLVGEAGGATFNEALKAAQGAGDSYPTLSAAAYRLGKILPNAAKTGAAISGTQAIVGGNKPIDQLATPEGVSDVATKTLGGGLLGIGLGTLGVGTDAVASKFAEGSIPLLSDAAKRYTLGRNGTNLFDAKKLTQDTANKVTELGEEGLGSQVKQLGENINQVMGAAEESGNKADLSSLMNHIEDLKQQADAVKNPDVKEELNHLITYVEDRISPNPKALTTESQLNPSEEVTQEYEPSQNNPTDAETGDSAVTTSPIEAQRLEKDLGNMRYGGKLTTPEAQNAAKKADLLTSGKVNTATESAAFPEGYAPLRQQSYLLNQAAQNLELPIKSPSDFYVRTPDGGSMFNPDVSKALENAVRKSLTSPQDAQKMNLGFDFLKQAGVENVDALKDSVMKAVQNEDLGVNPPDLKNIISPIGSAAYKAAKFATAIPNALGQTVAPIANAIQKVAPITSAPTVIGNAAIQETKDLANKVEPSAGASEIPSIPKEQKDYLGNKIKPDEKKTPSNFSKQLYSATPQQLTNIIPVLKTGGFQNYADSLENAIKVGDQQKINGVLFVLASNPKTRELLQGPVPEQTGNTGGTTGSTIGNGF